MKTYIALLRGINVGGHNKIKMADLKQLFTELGHTNVQTYIQSGNVIFQTELENEEIVAEQLQQRIQARWGFQVPVFVCTTEFIAQCVANNPFKSQYDISVLHYSFFKQDVLPPEVDVLHENEVHFTENCAYLVCAHGYSKTAFSNAYLEKLLKTSVTTRNAKTVHHLLDLVNA